MQRLAPPVWAARPAPGSSAPWLTSILATAARAAFLNAAVMAAELAALGVRRQLRARSRPGHPEAAPAVVGDRSYGDDPARVSALGRAVAEGTLAGGALPVIKHLPGHGRGAVDSHFELPRIDAAAADLQANDFLPFQALADLPLAMTGHLLIPAYDAARPVTTSPAVIDQVIRGEIGFDGLLMSDDLSMQAHCPAPLARAPPPAWRPAVTSPCIAMAIWTRWRRSPTKRAISTPPAGGGLTPPWPADRPRPAWMSPRRRPNWPI